MSGPEQGPRFPAQAGAAPAESRADREPAQRANRCTAAARRRAARRNTAGAATPPLSRAATPPADERSLLERRRRRAAFLRPVLFEPRHQIELLQDLMRRAAPAVELFRHADHERVRLSNQLQRAIELLGLRNRRP